MSSFCLFLLPLPNATDDDTTPSSSGCYVLRGWKRDNPNVGDSSAEGCRFKFLREQRGFLSYHVAIYRLERQRNQILWDSGGVNWVLGRNVDDIPFRYVVRNYCLLNWNDFSLRRTRWRRKYFKYNCAALIYIHIFFFILNENWHSGRCNFFCFW